MIKRSSLVGLAITAILATSISIGFSSCAKTEPLSVGGLGEASFKAWLAKYDPQAQAMPSGIYIHFKERGDMDFLKPKLDESWFRFDYTIYAMNGVIAISRDSVRAKLVGTWAPVTHFGDDFLPYKSGLSSNYPEICEGLRDAFQYLRVGDSARIYIPSQLAYSGEYFYEYFNKGNICERATLPLMPLYFDVRVNEIVNSPKDQELLRVQDYVRLKWGILAKDSIGYGLYMRLLEDYPTGDSIKKDTTVRYFYSERFLDRHLLETNVEKVSEAAGYLGYVDWKYDVNKFEPSSFNPVGSDTTNQRLFSKVFLNMKTGQTVEVISTSQWTAQGNRGKTSNIPQILPYEPRTIQIKTLKWDQSEEEADYDFKLLK